MRAVKSCAHRDAASAASSGTTPPGERPGTTETMKTDDNRSATASPRGGGGEQRFRNPDDRAHKITKFACHRLVGNRMMGISIGGNRFKPCWR